MTKENQAPMEPSQDNERQVPIVVVAVVALYIIFCLYGLWPYLSSKEAVLSVIHRSSELGFIEEEAKLAEESGPGGLSVENELTISMPLSSMVDATVLAYVSDNATGLTIRPADYRLSLRADRVILQFAGLVLVFTLAIYLTAYLTSARFTALRVSKRVGLTLRKEGKSETPQSQSNTAEIILDSQVRSVYERATDLDARSIALLLSGIVIASVGVGVFYVTLPPYAEEVTLSNYLSRAIRPTGLLVFVEGIAWFLLRQYRALTEDYKWFHRAYLKRANYLAAYKLVQGGDATPETLFVVASLLSEDISGRLAKGENTESKVAQKPFESDPIYSLLEKIITHRHA